MAAQHPEIVVVRRRGAHEGEHHGGAWKIAFADFMTAMMAFFLVLWIISATDKNTKTLIARYFNPVKVEEPAKAQKGIHGVPEKDAYQTGAGSVAPSPGKAALEHGESAGDSADQGAPANGSNQNDQRGLAPPNSPPDPAKPYPTMSEQELFSDPRASLDRIAGASPPGPRIDPSAALKGYGEVGPSADEALRDPFRPLGSDEAVNVVTSNPGPRQRPARPPKKPLRCRRRPCPRLNRRTLLSKPGGRDRRRRPWPIFRRPTRPRRAGPPHRTCLPTCGNGLAGEAPANQGPQLNVEATQDGVLISLTDRQNFSMFAIGSAEPQPRVLRMMDAIAASLESMPGVIIVRGHTDARPYRSATYDNWRLSSARAQMAYYTLNRGGLAEKRFERIEGYADRHLKDPSHPLAAEKPKDRNSRARADAVIVHSRVWASAVLALLAPAAAFADPANLADMVDDLQRIQVRVALGDRTAYAAQLNQLKRICEGIAFARHETWRDRLGLACHLYPQRRIVGRRRAAPERRRHRRVRASAGARRARLRHQS
jgi:chemotaxis protein MotB